MNTEKQNLNNEIENIKDFQDEQIFVNLINRSPFFRDAMLKSFRHGMEYEHLKSETEIDYEKTEEKHLPFSEWFVRHYKQRHDNHNIQTEKTGKMNHKADINKLGELANNVISLHETMDQILDVKFTRAHLKIAIMAGLLDQHIESFTQGCNYQQMEKPNERLGKDSAGTMPPIETK